MLGDRFRRRIGSRFNPRHAYGYRGPLPLRGRSSAAVNRTACISLADFATPYSPVTQPKPTRKPRHSWWVALAYIRIWLPSKSVLVIRAHSLSSKLHVCADQVPYHATCRLYRRSHDEPKRPERRQDMYIPHTRIIFSHVDLSTLLSCPASMAFGIIGCMHMWQKLKTTIWLVFLVSVLN